ncbi:transcription-associated protein 1 [Vanrija albida]|uniref:Transcription-associated protein 1 n=1 Tax=Vanrija albida TaxID=181172 RepID=A0ABR3Q5S1_9TREE
MSTPAAPKPAPGRPRKASTATAPGGTPTAESSTPGASAHHGPPTAAPTAATGITTTGPSTLAECEALAAQLSDTNTPMRRRMEIASELRDSAESNRDYVFYDKYLGVFIPALVAILGEEKNIVFVKDNSEQRFRHTLLAYLQRLPHSEPFRQYETKVMELMVKLLKVENEDNALLCIKIMIDGFRSHKDQAEPFVEPFLELVKQMYANLKGVVEKEFGKPPGAPAATDAAATPATPVQPSSSNHTHLSHALHSPKVLTECPIAVVLIFQTYKSVMGPAMLDFYPLVMESIKIQPEPQRVAHQEAKERGDIFVGVASGITNREMYTELIKTQVKTMAFLAYVLRGSQANVKDYLEVFPEACIRLLRDCPPEDVSTRKELLVATRHILTADSRSSFIPYIDTLLEERVLVGTGVSSREALRPLASSVVADLIHHVRNELPIAQLSRVVYVFSCNLNDSTFSSSIQTMCAKLLNTIVESIASKGDAEQSARLMKSMFITSLEKLQAMTEAYDKLKALSDRDKGKGKAKDDAASAPASTSGQDVTMADETDANADANAERLAHGWREIEQAMPVNQVAYANESLETFCREARYLFKTLLHTFRTLLNYTKNGDNPIPPPDGELLAKFFEYSLRCIAIFDNNRDPREPKEAIELLSQILLLLDQHSFREVWTTHMDFFVENALQNPHVFSVLQILITHDSVSHQLVAITLKHLMNHLDDVGSYTPKHASLTLRLFKISFLAINTYISTNEIVLVPHLQKLIMRSFALAPKAQDPTVYYQILRALFRSIGGGRFDALYKEVLPILQEMLDNLSYLLQHATDPVQRDLFVELTLTVPVRLTNLLPHLSYLMKPLVHALQAGSELISQGLRTLELCIDNLTADFLDPTMTPVFRELMGALHKLLRPVPANRQHSHAAVKILGKLGGRNRRFNDVENLLEYKPTPGDITAPISFEGKRSRFELDPLVAAADEAIKQKLDVCQDDGLEVLMFSALEVLHEERKDTEATPVFQATIAALFRATQGSGPTAEKALEFVRSFCKRIFLMELKRTDEVQDKSLPDLTNRHRPFPLTLALTDAIVNTHAESTGKERDQIANVLGNIISDFKSLAQNPEFTGKETSRNIDRFVLSFVRRFTGLCQDEDWNRKMAGVTAMNVFVREAELNRKYIIELELEFVRVLMFALRDAPRDPPTSVKQITDLIQHLIRTCQSQEDGRGHRLSRLTEILVRELNSQSKLAREAAQSCIKLLAEVIDQPISTVIGPTTRQVLLDASAGPIFSKPLRALSSFAMQVGNIDCVTYLLDLRPSVPEINDEFVRLVQEVLALADVDDASLIPNKRGDAPSHKQNFWLKALRIACLRMLRSTMNCQEFYERPNLAPIRQRIITVYFKHVYSTSPEIVDVAHEGLRDVIQQQNKLPKEVLQSGLRPILVNLADAKRLSVPGLEGLARFLELLTNYFKVEIGVKLLDHFDTLADAQMLQKAAAGPLEDNPDISRMTRLVNIFRLLPATAVQYLKQLTTQVVEVESQLHQSAPGPFTENIAKYLDRYHSEGAQNLLDNIKNPRVVWTYRNIISSGKAPQLVNELSERAEAICTLAFANPEQFDLVVPGLHIIRELSRTSPGWLSEREPVLEAVVGVWRSIVLRSRDPKSDMSNVNYQTIPVLILEMFMSTLEHQQHIALLFHVVEAYEIRSSFDRSYVAFFLYQRVALQESVEYRREVIEYFMNLYEEETVVTWAFKTNALRLVVNPTLRVYFADPTNDGSLITAPLVTKMAEKMWRPLSTTPVAKSREDTLLIEIFALTTLMVKHAGPKVSDMRKEVFKLAWMGINLLEPTVKLMAYVLTANFMETYETPVKFVRLTWTGLLRLKENESKALFRQAIDTLASCLSVRDPPTNGGIPDWAQKVKTVLVEEGHATSTLVVVCELLVNHPDLFYDYRELYVPHIAMSLQKLGFVQAATAEMKKLTVDVIELIFRWERKRMALRDEAGRDDSTEAMDVDEKDGAAPSPAKRQRIDRAGTAVSTTSGGGWVTPSSTRELITAHLLRIVASSSEPVTRGGLSKRALDLFKEILGPKGLPNVSVKLGFFNRTMSQDISEQTIGTVANSTEVIAAVAEVRDQAWIRGKLEVFRKLLEKVWVFDDTSLHEVVRPLTERMFAELPEEEVAESDDDAQKLLKFVSTTVNNGLQASLRSHNELPGTIFLLKCWLKVQPTQLHNEALASGLLRVLSNLVKVHTSANGPDPSYRLIISILDMLRDRVADLKEHRRYLVNILGALIDKSTNLTLCRYLLDLVRQWVVKEVDGPIVIKDKALLLLRMMVFEGRDNALFKDYLDLIYEVYELESLSGTDITHRLEPAFLLGTRSKDPAQRAKFLDKLEATLPRALDARLEYLYSLQNWETLANSYWIPQMLSLLLGAADLRGEVFRAALPVIADEDPLAQSNWRLGNLIQYVRNLVHVDPTLAHRLWVVIFPKLWASFTRAQQTSFTPYISKLLCKEFHHKQVELKPNVIQTQLEGIAYCKPPVTVPPLLIKYLAKTYNAWYAGFEILNTLSDTYRGTENLRESCAGALGELYAELGEEDMFYGSARCRYVYPETTAALTLEQNGKWPQAMEMYEQTMVKARHATLPFTEDEFCLWEDHWILAAQKLQNWESLTELARADQNPDLLLECAWRLSDWGSPDREMIENNLKLVAGVPTPRRKIFEAFTALIKAHGSREPPNDFLRIVDDAQQVAIRKWTTLPTSITGAHLPLLQLFQQVVELGEAAQVFDSLQMTTAQTLEARVNNELKGIFQTWRDRLPNFWDDISVWSDLLAWRQHVFQAVTRVYMPMIQPTETATHGYRGYHETAWMINRFGEVARRHGLLDVCSTALNKIYMLPNIEISEAFLKLREQALCYFQKPEKFNEGLDNISTTNLMYFAQPQKAEFLTLKGMFISRLGQDSDANDEFAHAVQMDYNLPKAWAEWGKFNEKMYRQQPEAPPPGSKPEPGPGEKRMTDAEWAESWAQDRALRASSAVSCYLQAAGLYANHKSRALLLRVLWLLGLDDNRNTIAKAFEAYKGDLVIWYWITLIPQLLLSLSHREAQIARHILMHIAKAFPQALFYSLRVTKEDFSNVKKSQVAAQLKIAQARKLAEAKAAAEKAGAAGASGSTPAATEGTTPGAEVKPETKEGVKDEAAASTPAGAAAPSTPASGGASTPAAAAAPAAGTPAAGTPGAAANGSMAPPQGPIAPNRPPQPRQPWEFVDEIINHLKTGVPLLALSMEKMVDQIGYRAKPTSEEDIYRFFSALLNDAMQQWSTRGAFLSEEQELGPNTRDNLRRFSLNLHSDLRAAVERDFINNQPKMREYIKRLQFWRDFYEKAIDSRPRHQPLDSSGINLTDFHYTKFEDVEVPGQYVQHIDQADELIRIARFHPRAELCRGFGFCFRRITMIGHNGTPYTFNVQMPAARHCRREERLVQLFRIMNSVLKRRKESRRRNLQFHLPTAVALGTQLRLIQNDSSYISLQEIYDDYAFAHGMTHEDTILAFCDRQRELHDPSIPRTDPRWVQLKMEIIEEIQAKMLPENVLTNYMIKSMADSESLWLMRKQFAMQTAACAFLTYVCCLNNRAPSRFHISRRTGQMYMTEMLPSFTQGQPLFHSPEAVPFRLTPNMQHFITRVGVEGVVSASATAIAHSLTLPEFDLASTLHLFIRDEILTWQNTYNKGGDQRSDVPLTANVYKNVDQFIKRAELMGHIGEVKEKVPGGPVINHAMVTLISQATAPALLAAMSETFMAWF